MLNKKIVTRLSNILTQCEELVDSNGVGIYETFRVLPPRTGDDLEYYKLIKHPVSFFVLKNKVKNSVAPTPAQVKTKNYYTSVQEFINDLNQMGWNARFFNQKNSIFYDHGEVLDRFIKNSVIPSLNRDKIIDEEVKYVDLGEIPDDSATMVDGPITGGGGPMIPGDDHEDFEFDEEFDDYPTTRPVSTTINNVAHVNYNGKIETGIKRGRPPAVDKPFEIRIKSILKNFRKLRHPQDSERPLSTPFDKLPEKNETAFYNLFHDPISLAEIRTKLRLKKYKSVDEFIQDFNEFINIYKTFLSQYPNPEIFQDLMIFETQARIIIKTELEKTDEEIASISNANGDGIIRLPLDEIVRGVHSYKVGDWVLINNPINPDKPIVGQIFRLWLTDNKEYINICWYYRPEQTCHREDRLFYINEVCKTGQYRDHLANEIIGPCFVLFLTRYQKGDLPANFLPDNCPWFICEFRYNETNHVFNRIRTWRACLPDEVRDNEDPPVIQLTEPRKLIKYESPIKRLLPAHASYDMPIPMVVEDSPYAPPIVGAVYSRPPDVDDDLGQYYTSPNITRSKEHDDVLNDRKAFLFTPISQSKSFGYPPIIANNNYNFDNSPSTPNYYQPTPATSFSPFKYKEKRQGTPTPNGNLHTSTSNYSMLLEGGVVSYAKDDEHKLSYLSEGIIKRQKLNNHEILWFRGPPVNVTNQIISSNEYPIGNSAKYLSWKLKSKKTV